MSVQQIFDREFIETIKSRICLVELLESYGVSFCLCGGHYEALCPFHDEKSPSFKIGREADHYHCYGCGEHGDAISFLRKTVNLSFSEAVEQLALRAGLPLPMRKGSRHRPILQMPTNLKHSSRANKPSVDHAAWRSAAQEFVQGAQEVLLKNRDATAYLQERGLGAVEIKQFRLGWNSSDRRVNRKNWGLPAEENKNKPLWIPQGLVISYSHEGTVPTKIKIRRQIVSPDDKLPRYYELPGSESLLARWELEAGKPACIVESELDAMLLVAQAGDLCGVVALGGASKKPDEKLLSILRLCPRILFSVDYDSAGAKQTGKWCTLFQKEQLARWPTPKDKDPGDAYRSGVDIREWICLGLSELLRDSQEQDTITLPNPESPDRITAPESVLSWHRIALDSGHIEPGQPELGQWLQWPSRKISFDTHWVDYRLWLSREENHHYESASKSDFICVAKEVFSAEGDAYQFPPLEVCRERYATKFGSLTEEATDA